MRAAPNKMGILSNSIFYSHLLFLIRRHRLPERLQPWGRNAMPEYRIMIVDDESEVREGIASRVDWKAAGFTIVATAENGQDALEKAEFLDLDVVLTDIKMPYMDGLTLGAELLSRSPTTKLIILTGFDEFEYATIIVSSSIVLLQASRYFDNNSSYFVLLMSLKLVSISS